MTGKTGMQHLTLDTGHTRVSFRDEIAPAVLEQMKPLTVTGTHPMPDPPGGTLQVSVDGSAVLATVLADDDAPLVTLAVAADADGAQKLWRLIGGPDVAEPTATPWLAVKLQVGVWLHPAATDWLGDFERCWAWAWLAQAGSDE